MIIIDTLDRNKNARVRQTSQNLVKAFELLTQFPEGFFEEDRQDPPPQERDFYV